MCGITGIVSLSEKIPGITQHVKNMNDAIRHRGPDGEGYLLFDGSETFLVTILQKKFVIHQIKAPQ